MATAVSQHVRHLEFVKNFTFSQTAASFPEISKKNMFLLPQMGTQLTLKLTDHFATHIQARGGGFVDPPKIFETANN